MSSTLLRNGGHAMPYALIVRWQRLPSLVNKTRSAESSLKLTVELTKTLAHPVFFINRYPLVWFN
jgi:hypothetical protein